MGIVQNFISRLKIGMISFKQSLYKAHSSLQLKYKHKYSMVHTSDTSIGMSVRGLYARKDGLDISISIYTRILRP